MAGLACGIALPLLFAIGMLYYLLRREKRRFSKPKLMYKLPDDVKEDYSFKPPPPVGQASTLASDRSSHASGATSNATSRRGSLRTLGTLSTSRPVVSQATFPSSHSQTFLERYETMKRNAQIQSQEVSMPRHELDSITAGTPTKEIPTYELSETRMSS